MNYSIYFYIFSVFMLAAPLQGMQEASTVDNEAYLQIRNETTDSIEILAKFEDMSEPLPLRIEPREELKLSPIGQLRILNVSTYGRFKSLLNFRKLAFGLVPPYNVTEEPELKAAIESNNSVKLVIRHGGSVVSSVTSNATAVKTAAILAPYSFEVISVEEEPERKYHWMFFHFFPRANRAFNDGQPIYPRYFLNLPENATVQAARQAYEMARSNWSAEINDVDPEKQKLAQQALVFVKAGYRALNRAGGYVEAFDRLVGEEIEAPTVYNFKQKPMTQEEIDDWIAMGGTYEPQNSGLN